LAKTGLAPTPAIIIDPTSRCSYGFRYRINVPQSADELKGLSKRIHSLRHRRLGRAFFVVSVLSPTEPQESRRIKDGSQSGVKQILRLAVQLHARDSNLT
jgi:hypothetical protein